MRSVMYTLQGINSVEKRYTILIDAGFDSSIERNWSLRLPAQPSPNPALIPSTLKSHKQTPTTLKSETLIRNLPEVAASQH